MKRLILTGLLLLIGGHTLAQGDDCPVLERAAIAETRIWCSELESGQICYGNSPLTAASDAFRVPGDRLNAAETASLIASREGGFGIGVIRTTGYTPDSWQPHDLSMVLLGSAELTNLANENRSIPAVTAAITDSQGANVRSGPSTEFRILAALFERDLLRITGITAPGDWLRVQLPDGETGWIISDAVQIEIANLPQVSRDDEAPGLLYAPFTDLELTAAAQDARCTAAPESGLLVQGPLESAVRLRVNGLQIAVQGTVFLQTAADSLLTIYVIEGSARVQEALAETGDQMRFALPAAGESTAEPLTAPYDFSRMAAVPTEMLPRYTYIGIDLATIITPAPAEDRSPIADMLVTDPCVITTGPGGANLRGGPGPEFPVRGVLALRETARPISRIQGSDGQVWWELAQNVWISAMTTVTGGDCVAVPQAERIPALPPTPAADN